MGKVRINVGEFKEKVIALILKVARENIPGEDKLEKVLDDIARWGDEQLKWSFLGPLGIAVEALDGMVIRQLIALPVQLVYDELKAAGKV
jgi:hypothetical protein